MAEGQHQQAIPARLYGVGESEVVIAVNKDRGDHGTYPTPVKLVAVAVGVAVFVADDVGSGVGGSAG